MGKQADDKVMVHICITKELDKRIAELAARMEISKAALGSHLLEAAVEDNEFIIRAVSHPMVKKAYRALKGKVPSQIKIQME
jgi:DNA mismatch repair ATPase MutS